MAIIDVRAPDGSIVKVRIAGETPTEQERRTIAQGLKRMAQTGSPSMPEPRYVGNPGFDVVTASPEQIREFGRLRQQAGFTSAGEQMAPEEFAEVYREEGVDYETGLQDVGNFSRFGYGRMETDEGRANYLRRAVGEGGYRQDALGRFVLTQQGRRSLGMEPGPEVAIDEEGLSWGDVKEFLGQSGMPLAAGIGAGVAASGVGLVPGVLISAGAAGLAKALDEGIEYSQGLQDQTFDDVKRDVAMEALFSGGGEFAGRLLSKAFGRFFKGPDTKFGEEQRGLIRQALDEGGRPSIAGVTSKEFRPALRLADAFSQAVFPNEAAARSNLKVLLDQLSELRTLDPVSIENLGDALSRDITKKYGVLSEQIADNERYLTTVIERDLNKAAAALRKDGVIPKNLAEMLRLRKTIFDQNYDALVSSPLNVLKGQKFIPMGGVKATLDALVEESPAALRNSDFVKRIYELAGETGNARVTYEDIARIRSGIGEAMKKSDLVNGASIQSLVTLRSSLTSALEDAEVALQRAVDMPLPDGSIVADMDGMTIRFDQASEALGFMRRANSLYRNAMRRFDNVETLAIIKQAQIGQLNEGYVLKEVLKENNPEALDQLLRAIRGAKYVQGLGQGPRTARRQLINGMTVQRARAEMELLPEGSEARRLLAQRIREVEEQTSLVRGASRVGAAEAERVRKSFATMYLDKVIRESTIPSPLTGVNIIDQKKFVANFSRLGSTLNVLFRNEKAALDDLLYVMNRSTGDIAPSIVEQMFKRSPDLAEAITDVKAAIKAQEKTASSQLMRVFESGEPEAVAREVLKSPRNLRQAEEVLDADTMDQVRDAAMMTILRQVDLVPSSSGKFEPSDDLFNGFESGRLGERFKTILNSYDKETLNGLFGTQTANELRRVAENMTRFSNAAIKGKGSLVAAGVAGTMAGFGVLFSPFATLAPLAKFYVLSRALRRPEVLRVMSRTRDKNSVRQFMSGKLKSGDPLGQALQVIQQLVLQATVQGTRGVSEQTEQETRAMQQLARREVETAQQEQGVENMLQGLERAAGVAGQAVTAPMTALALQVDAAPPPAAPAAAQRVNPILVPNPLTRATFGQ